MIYLDHAATTPVPREVADTMYEVLMNQFGNPSSQYQLGLDMKKRVENWRKTVAGAASRSSSSSPPAAPRATTGPSPPPAGRTGTWGATSSPRRWSTTPCWRPASGWKSRAMR